MCTLSLSPSLSLSVSSSLSLSLLFRSQDRLQVAGNYDIIHYDSMFNERGR